MMISRCLPLFIALVLGPGPSAAESGPDPVVAATERVELRSDPRVNLRHFLIAWTAAEAGEWPPYALPLAERH